jgi:hypothetical protein
MKLSSTFATLAALASVAVAAASQQQVFSETSASPLAASPSKSDSFNIEEFVEQYEDPVEAMKAYDPSSAYELDQPRLIEVFGEGEPVWMTEGDKLRLRKNGKAFMDVTEFRDVKRKDAFAASSEHSEFLILAHTNTRMSLILTLYHQQAGLTSSIKIKSTTSFLA